MDLAVPVAVLKDSHGSGQLHLMEPDYLFCPTDIGGPLMPVQLDLQVIEI